MTESLLPTTSRAEVQQNGHEYHVQQSLGKFSHLKPARLMTDLKMGKVFPFPILSGSLASVGMQAKLGVPLLTCLRCIPLFVNRVEVIVQTPTAIRLKACADHIFQGSTLEMRIEKVGEELIYFVDGYGHEKEALFRYYSNLLFARLGLWHLFIKMNVTPYAKRLEKQLSK